jgi:3-phenylpropionate/cinnamic acid dioxygenase small subunit
VLARHVGERAASGVGGGGQLRAAVARVAALHGHLVDDGELDRLDELFTADAVYDVSALGQGTVRGLAGFRELSRSFADDERNPVGHHVTNVIVGQDGAGVVTVRSKAIGVLRDGRAGSVTYDDRVTRTDRGWRIAERRITPARR